ncbi:MAG: FHA domain-containing protein [Anaerolineae bacterium]|nr:FHA domain-containing protein [Anaerolineae bacterium]
MIICPHCQAENIEGTIFCEQCGKSLLAESGASAVSTQRLDKPTDDLGAKATWGTARFDEHATIVMHIHEAPYPIELKPAQETILGRVDSASGARPHIDLTPHGALQKGVSRIHAAIRRGDDTLTLVDLGSVNGTYLNGQRLVPNQPRVLRDGDEVRLGSLISHIYFK